MHYFADLKYLFSDNGAGFDHVASGIRHIDLGEKLKVDCPKLSAVPHISHAL